MRAFLCVFLCYSIVYNILNVNGNKTAVADMIKDFLLLQKPSPKITVFSCWQKKDNIKFWKTLHEANYYVTVINLPHIQIPVIKPVTKQLFVLDTNCDEYYPVLHEANILKLFQQPYEWIILTNTAIQISPHFEILPDSKFYIVSQETPATFPLRAVYKISPQEEYITNDVGIWKTNAGFEYYKSLSTVRNRTNFMGRPFNLSLYLFDSDSSNHLTDYRDKHVDGLSKMAYACISKMVETMNASENLLIQPEPGYYNKSTKIYSGVVGDLQLGRAEVTGTVSYITAHRISLLDYFAMIPQTRSVFIFRKPPLSYVSNIYILPFDKMVWFASFLLIGIVPLAVYLIIKWEWFNPEAYGLTGEARNALRLRFFDVVLMELGAVCQQGAEAEPRSGAGRIATISIFVAFMFLYTSHSANIVALLQSTSDTIQTVDDLLNSKIKLGAEDLVYTRQFFLVQTESTRKAIYAQKIAPRGQPPNFFNLEAGIAKMRHEFFGFLVITTNAYKVVSETFQENEKCNLREIDYWGLKPPHFAIRKNSSYKELIKVGYRKVDERGIQSCEVSRLCTKKPACQAEGGNFKNVELVDCYFAFVIFMGGVGISFIILIAECIFAKTIGHR